MSRVKENPQMRCLPWTLISRYMVWGNVRCGQAYRGGQAYCDYSFCEQQQEQKTGKWSLHGYHDMAGFLHIKSVRGQQILCEVILQERQDRKSFECISGVGDFE